MAQVKSDYVISAADGHETIFEMLEGKFVDDKVQEYYNQFPVFTPLVYVGLGVNRSFEDTDRIISGISSNCGSLLELENQQILNGPSL